MTLEPLRNSGYGSARLQRLRPNVITVMAQIDGKAKHLLVDSSWLEDGVGLTDESIGTSATPVTGSSIPTRGRGPLREPGQTR